MKRYKIVFSAHALNDLQHARDYYDQQQKNLGKRFIKQVEITLQSIRNNPLYFSIRYDEVRCANVLKFPFLIHYAIHQSLKQITILAVYSTHQTPLWD